MFCKVSVLALLLGLLLNVTMAVGSDPVQADVTITQTMSPGMPRSLGINCSFTKQPGSPFKAVISITLAKTEDKTNGNFRDIATVSLATGETMEVTDSLGAVVFGHLSIHGNSYISYQWSRGIPHAAEGRYRCAAAGLNRGGEVISSKTYSTVDKSRAVMTEVLGKIQALEVQQNHLMAGLTSAMDDLYRTSVSLQHTAQRLNQTDQRLANTTKHFNILQSVVLTSPSSTFVNMTTHNSHVYLLSQKRRVKFSSFDDACRQVGGYLVEIDDEAEYDALASFLRGAVVNEYIMLGGTDEDHENHWTYFRSGRAMTFLKWASGEPNNGRAWNCLELYTGDMMMKDYPCLDKADYRFICEIP